MNKGTQVVDQISDILAKENPNFKHLLDIALKQEKEKNEIQGQKVLTIFKMKDQKIKQLELEVSGLMKEIEKIKELLED